MADLTTELNGVQKTFLQNKDVIMANLAGLCSICK